MGDLKKPLRSPDYTDENTLWSYWFKEMVSFEEDFPEDKGVTLIIKNGLLHWVSEYDGPCREDKCVIEAYRKWLISKCLKEKINE